MNFHFFVFSIFCNIPPLFPIFCIIQMLIIHFRFPGNLYVNIAGRHEGFVPACVFSALILFQCLCHLVGAGRVFPAAADAVHAGNGFLHLHILYQTGDALQVAAAAPFHLYRADDAILYFNDHFPGADSTGGVFNGHGSSFFDRGRTSFVPHIIPVFSFFCKCLLFLLLLLPLCQSCAIIRIWCA